MRVNKLILVTLLLSFQSNAAQIKIAVASNFSQAMQAIAEQFEQETHHDVILISGSTGKIYAQIHNGAPFDAFFAADVLRPQKLEQHDLILPGSRFTYAIGKIVLWSTDPALIDSKGKIISTMQFRHLAIANPKLAPYGVAAKQVIESQGMWQALQGKIVRGENINQAFHFVESGNAELGFVALSQIKHLGTQATGSIWKVPNELYSPIQQQAVQLTDKPEVTRFIDYVKKESVKRIIRSYGYDVN